MSQIIVDEGDEPNALVDLLDAEPLSSEDVEILIFLRCKQGDASHLGLGRRSPARHGAVTIEAAKVMAYAEA
jgi:hypothetical protein